jgi:HK97 family phage prohead protease
VPGGYPAISGGDEMAKQTELSMGDWCRLHGCGLSSVVAQYERERRRKRDEMRARIERAKRGEYDEQPAVDEGPHSLGWYRAQIAEAKARGRNGSSAVDEDEERSLTTDDGRIVTGDLEMYRRHAHVVGRRETRGLTAAPAVAPTNSGLAGRIGGYAAVYNSRSEKLVDANGGFYETIAPGAFGRSLAQDDVRALWQHNTDQVLGRKSAGTLRLSEDARGVAFELDLPNTTAGKDAAELVRRRDVTGMSFGFMVSKERWSTGKDAKGNSVDMRTVTEGELLEISPVSWPAYKATTVSLRKKGA